MLQVLKAGEDEHFTLVGFQGGQRGVEAGGCRQQSTARSAAWRWPHRARHSDHPVGPPRGGIGAAEMIGRHFCERE